MKKFSPVEMPQIIYARATIRNLITNDETGNTDDLVAAVELLDQAEEKFAAYVLARDVS